MSSSSARRLQQVADQPEKTGRLNAATVAQLRHVVRVAAALPGQSSVLRVAPRPGLTLDRQATAGSRAPRPTLTPPLLCWHVVEGGAPLAVVLGQAQHLQAHLLGAQAHAGIVGQHPGAGVLVEVVQVGSAAQNR